MTAQSVFLPVRTEFMPVRYYGVTVGARGEYLCRGEARIQETGPGIGRGGAGMTAQSEFLPVRAEFMPVRNYGITTRGRAFKKLAAALAAEARP